MIIMLEIKEMYQQYVSASHTQTPNVKIKTLSQLQLPTRSSLWGRLLICADSVVIFQMNA